MTDQQVRFVENYLLYMNVGTAAIAAGYSSRSSGVQGTQVLQLPHVKAEVLRRQREEQARFAVSTDRVIREYAAVGFANVIDFFRIDEDTGLPVLKELHELTRDQTAAISKLTVVADPETGRVTTRFEMSPKVKALDSLAKMLGLFAEDNRQKGAALGGALAGGIAMLKLDDFSPEERDFIRQMAERRAKVLERKSADDATQIEDIEPDV